MANGEALIAARVARLATEFSQEPFALYQGRAYDWASVVAVKRVLEGALDGIEARSAVAVVLRQRPSCLAAVIALWASGRCVHLLSPLRPDRAIAADARALAPAAVVAEPEDWERVDVSGAGAVMVEVGTASAGVVVGLRSRPGGPSAVTLVPEQYAATITTSGTTGTPRRYALSWEDLTDVTDVRDPQRGRGVLINALPLFSIGGVRAMATTVLGGRPIALMERFDVIEWAGLIRDHQPRRAGAPPAVLRMVLDAQIPLAWLRSVRSLYSASAPLSVDLAEEFESVYGIPVVQGYGATEFLGGVTGWPGDLHENWGNRKKGSSGRALPGVKLRVVDPDTRQPLGRDQTGNLEVDSSRRAQGMPVGWVATNDLARIDGDGFVWILGRSDDVIIRGGFKVSLPVVERVLRRHPKVSDACVVGLTDGRLGEVPAALVVPDGSGQPTENELIHWVREELAPYDAPVVVAICDAIPVNTMMKPDRITVRTLLNAELDSRRRTV